MSPEWKIESAPIPYEQALDTMDKRVSGIVHKTAEELVWLLQHPPLYTAGTSAKAQDLLNPRFPVYQTGRGGQYTYHGPGQLVAYVMLDLKRREPDIKAYVYALEEWVIRTLAQFEVTGQRRKDRVGIWVCEKEGQEVKIAAIGVRLRKWVTFHGVSLNIDPDLSHFNGIVPCGLKDYGVTSLKSLGHDISTRDVCSALKRTWSDVFETKD